ncbi:MAG: PIN domain-containing protein [Rhizobiaceae bacterium]|nr:PIN domain-containing protein [Rhizobiaceae bacterium]
MTRSARNFLDTNILIYAFADEARTEKAQSLLAEPFVVSVQALSEFANVSRKKLGVPWMDIQEAIKTIVKLSATIVPIDEKMTLAALVLAERYKFPFYDALMVAAALEANCERFYSEDLHHGLLVEMHLTVTNPFR